MEVYYGVNGERYCTTKFIESRYSGHIFDTSDPLYEIKIYKSTWAKPPKINARVHKINDCNTVLWPVDLIISHDSDKALIGYVSPKVRDKVCLKNVVDSKIDLSVEIRQKIIINLCHALNEIHSEYLTVNGINADSIYVNINTGELVIRDVDQLIRKKTANIVAFVDKVYNFPIEDEKEIINKYPIGTIQADYYSLAVFILKFLFDADVFVPYTPYNGGCIQYYKNENLMEEESDYIDRIVSIPILNKLMKRAFLTEIYETEHLPTCDDWINAFENKKSEQSNPYQLKDEKILGFTANVPIKTRPVDFIRNIRCIVEPSDEFPDIYSIIFEDFSISGVIESILKNQHVISKELLNDNCERIIKKDKKEFARSYSYDNLYFEIKKYVCDLEGNAKTFFDTVDSIYECNYFRTFSPYNIDPNYISFPELRNAVLYVIFHGNNTFDSILCEISRLYGFETSQLVFLVENVLSVLIKKEWIEKRDCKYVIL